MTSASTLLFAESFSKRFASRLSGSAMSYFSNTNFLLILPGHAMRQISNSVDGDPLTGK
jgi:hypothetical protein